MFALTFIQTDFFFQLVESPPKGQQEECRFKALRHWLQFSEPEVVPCPRHVRSNRQIHTLVPDTERDRDIKTVT